MMNGEIFNANPTVYAKSKRSPRKSRFETGKSLWVDEDEQVECSDTSDLEPIDQDEIFGELKFMVDALPYLTPIRPY